MKKRVAVVLLLVAMSLMCVLGLTACGAPKGTYDVYTISKSGDSSVELKTGSITFDGDGKISEGLYVGSSYSVSGSTLTITRPILGDITFKKSGSEWKQTIEGDNWETCYVLRKHKEEKK